MILPRRLNHLKQRGKEKEDRKKKKGKKKLLVQSSGGKGKKGWAVLVNRQFPVCREKEKGS